MAQVKADDPNDPNDPKNKMKGKKAPVKGQAPSDKDQNQGNSGKPPTKPDYNAEAQKQKQIEAQKAKQNAIKKQQLEADQAKQNALKKQKMEADQARQNALQKQKLQAEQAKQNALKKQQFEAQKAKQDALKQQKLDAAKANQDAIKKQQFEAQQAKDAIKKKQLEAERAKQDASKKQKLEAEQARQNALNKQKLEAEQAKQNAIKKKQLEAVGSKPPAFGPAKNAPKLDRVKADQEYEKARLEALRRKKEEAAKAGKPPGSVDKWEKSAARFDDLRKQRKERVELGGKRDIIEEPDRRWIVREKDRAFIRHDENERFKRIRKEMRRERRKDGTMLIVYAGLAGALIYALEDDHGRLLRRWRRYPDGREIVIIDNRRYYSERHYSDYDYYDAYVDVPPPVVRIPREKYVVEYEQASDEDVYDALSAPPIEDLDRGYSLDEVRQSYGLRERMRRVDLDAINFEFASWEVEPDQYPKLERIARAMQRILDRSPDEVFLIEGHTDAVGSDIDNLSLSDRRAESVAVILSDTFQIPPENLTTQGYGEQYLKVDTEEPSIINRRVAVRRITPLLSRAGADDFQE